MQLIFVNIGVQLFLKGKVSNKSEVLSWSDRKSKEINKGGNMGLLTLTTIHSKGKRCFRD